VKARGLLQPLVVTPIDGSYYLLDGHRRHAALTAAGFQDAPCVVRNGPVSESESEQLIDAVTTSVQRQDLPLIDEARAYRRMVDDGYHAKQIAAELGVSQKRVTERLALLGLPNLVQDMLNGGMLTQGHVALLLDAAKVSPKLAEAVGYTLGDQSIPAGRFQADPLGTVGTRSDPELGVWVFNGGWLGGTDKLPLTDKAKEAVDELTGLRDYGYRIQLGEGDIKAGVQFGAIWKPATERTYEHYWAIADREWFADRLEQRILKDLRAERREASDRAKAKAERAGVKAVDADGKPVEVSVEEVKEAERLQRVAERDERNKVHARNLELGGALLTKAAKLPVDRRTALNIATVVLRGTSSELAARGLAVVLATYAVEKSNKDGVVTNRSYDAELAACDVAGFIAEGSTPEEVFGRLAVVIGAAHLADTGAVAASNRPGYTWANSSDADFVKVLRELVAPALPASVRKGLGKGKTYLEIRAEGSQATRKRIVERRAKDAQRAEAEKAKAAADRKAARAAGVEGDGE
jgi:ParB/RepB/Spo0J family partition protein